MYIHMYIYKRTSMHVCTYTYVTYLQKNVNTLRATGKCLHK